MLMSTVFMTLNVLGNISGHKEVFIKEDIDTTHNTVGIDRAATCAIFYNPHHTPKHDECLVVCGGPGNHKKVFDNIGRVIGSSTGTPAWLEYKNYIGFKEFHNFVGSKILVDSTGPETVKTTVVHNKHEDGIDRRIILCDGPCEKRDGKPGESKEPKMRIMPFEE